MALAHDLAYADDQELWHDSERFRLVLENLNDHAIIMADPQGVITYWNSGAQHLFGYGSDEAVGRPLAMIFPEEDRLSGVAEREMKEAAANGQAENEGLLAGKYARAFVASGVLNAIFGRNHRLLGYIKVIRDETDRRKLEEELKTYRARLDVAQSTARIGTFEWNIETDAEIWNDGMYKVYSIPRGTTIGSYRDWIGLVHPEDVPRVEAAFAEAVHFRKDLAIENRILVPEGVRWIDCRGRAIYDEAGKPLRLIGIQMDITERKEAEEGLRRANNDLEQFAAIAAHDLQEPLRIVRSYMALVERSAAQLDEKTRGYLKQAVDGAARMQSLIRSMLELARIERGELVIEFTDMNDVVREALENLGQHVAETAAKVVFDSLPSVSAHRDHMVRLFQNLIGNSIKFRAPDAPPEIRIVAQSRAQYEWLFSVEDNGVGIPPAHRQDAFDMFRRLHSGGGESGFGIGLAVCKKIVERHHGSIWIESLGRGTTVHFTLPNRK